MKSEIRNPQSAIRFSDALIGVGGIGTGMFFALDGDHTLGRNESRPGRLLDVRDYCKLHIISHYVAVLTGAAATGGPAVRPASAKRPEAFRVMPVGLVGDDDAGRRLVQEMTDAGMDVSRVGVRTDLATLLSVCFQYPDGAGGNITTSNSACSALAAGDVAAVEEEVARYGRRCMVLAAPEVSLEVRMELLRIGRRQGAFNVASLASAEIQPAVAMGMLELVDLLAVNEDEAAALCGQAFDAANPRAFLDACGSYARGHNPAMRLLVSAGKAGAFACEAGRWGLRSGLKVDVASTAGAGDALLGGVLACLAAGIPLVSEASDIAAQQPQSRELDCALDIGVLLAALTVTSPHSIHPEASLATMMELADKLGLRIAAQLGPRLAR